MGDDELVQEKPFLERSVSALRSLQASSGAMLFVDDVPRHCKKPHDVLCRLPCNDLFLIHSARNKDVADLFTATGLKI